MAGRFSTAFDPAGGTPTVVFRAQKNIRAIGPDGRTFVLFDPNPRQRTVEIVSATGRVLARYTGAENLAPAGLSADGRALVGTGTNVTAPIRVVPVQGGRVVAATDDANYYWPAAWTADGETILVFGSTADGQNAIVTVPRTGGPARAAPLIPPTEARNARWWHANAEFAFYVEEVRDADRLRLHAVSRSDGSRTLISENFVRPAGSAIHGLGGRYFELGGGAIAFLERRGELVELRAARPGEPSRLLRAFPASYVGRHTFGVHGDRVVWYEHVGDSAHLVLADGPTGEPHRLISMSAGPNCCRISLAFSNDGRYLATYYDDGNRSDGLQILRLTADGRPDGAPRVIQLGVNYWYEPQWLPDNSGLTIVAGYTGMLTHVMLVPNRDGEQPVILTRDDPSAKWGQFLSPDGRHVAYPAEVWQGGSIWMMDLSPAVVARRR
jgi:hypothetical protein